MTTFPVFCAPMALSTLLHFALCIDRQGSSSVIDLLLFRTCRARDPTFVEVNFPG